MRQTASFTFCLFEFRRSEYGLLSFLEWNPLGLYHRTAQRLLEMSPSSMVIATMRISLPPSVERCPRLGRRGWTPRLQWRELKHCFDTEDRKDHFLLNGNSRKGTAATVLLFRLAHSSFLLTIKILLANGSFQQNLTKSLRYQFLLWKWEQT